MIVLPKKGNLQEDQYSVSGCWNHLPHFQDKASWENSNKQRAQTNYGNISAAPWGHVNSHSQCILMCPGYSFSKQSIQQVGTRQHQPNVGKKDLTGADQRGPGVTSCIHSQPCDSREDSWCFSQHFEFFPGPLSEGFMGLDGQAMGQTDGFNPFPSGLEASSKGMEQDHSRDSRSPQNCSRVLVLPGSFSAQVAF